MSSFEPEPGETIVLQKLANIRKVDEYAGGKLVLTNKRIVLLPHKFNLNSKPDEIALQDVAGVEPFNTLGLVPNGVRVKRKDGTEQKLVLWGRQSFMAAVRQAAGL